MSQIVRQNNLFSAEDWQTIYRTFSQADFKAYDYDSRTLESVSDTKAEVSAATPNHPNFPTLSA